MDRDSELKTLATRYVWWQPPELALANPRHFLCQVMTLGTAEDVRTLRRAWGDEAFVDALEHAPAGVMDAKSWNYWRLFFHRPPAPLPARPLP